MRPLSFTKMAASGNDFVVIDNRDGGLEEDLGELARRVCPRGTSVGADGLLVLENSRTAQLKMRIFNPDGSEPESCGNGLQCAALYAMRRRLIPSSAVIETAAGPVEAHCDGQRIKIKMSPPSSVSGPLTLTTEKGRSVVHVVNTGVPHAVCFVADVSSIPVQELGRAIRFHAEFQPQGTNADFVQVLGPGRIRLRTYERGVEAETLACGTGAVAAAVIARATGKTTESPVGVEARGGLLRVHLAGPIAAPSEVYLEGEPQEIYGGQLRPDG